ncbi:MAG: hypothetical protein ACPGGD_03140 [Thalassolituus sp.]
MEDEKIIALLDTKIGEEPDFVTPIPISVFNNAASIEQRVNSARDRVDQQRSIARKSDE